MKKTSLHIFALAALVAAPAAMASSFGVQAGTNLASGSFTAVGGGSIPSSTSAKFMGGIFYDYSFDDMFSVQTEVNYKATGLDWIAIPIQLKVSFNAGGIRPFLLLGPEVAFKISGAGYKSFDFLAVAGGGVAFDLTPTVALHVLGRYEIGFTNIADAPVVALGIQEAKNRGIHIMAGAAFKL